MIIRSIGIPCVLGVMLIGCSAPVSQTIFETDDAIGRREMANEHFYKLDSTRDWKITADDGAGWDKCATLDSDADDTVSFDEFVAGADLPFPEWPGEAQRNIVYKRAGGETLLLDFYPPLVKKYEKAPVFYYTHGGGWSGGNKEIDPSVRALFESLSREGFACVGVMYRLVKFWEPEDPVLMRDCIVDCRDGLRFLKKHETTLGLDMSRVVVFGSSAGGHITQILIWSGADDFSGDPELAPYKVEPIAGVSWYGPSDLRDTIPTISDGEKDEFAPDHCVFMVSKNDKGFRYGEADDKTRLMIEEVSPVCWLKKESAPLLHVHGDQDPAVSPRHAFHLEQHAKATGAPVEVLVVKGAGHGWPDSGIEPDRRTVEQHSIDFILHQVVSAVAQ